MPIQVPLSSESLLAAAMSAAEMYRLSTRECADCTAKRHGAVGKILRSVHDSNGINYHDGGIPLVQTEEGLSPPYTEASLGSSGICNHSDYCPALLHKWQETLVERLFTLPFETKMVNDWNKFPEAIAERGINPQLYTTDISNWVCSCQPFLKSSYFTCKHLFQVRTKLWTEGHQRPTDINNHNHDGFFGCADVWNRQASTKTNECFPLLSTPFCSF